MECDGPSDHGDLTDLIKELEKQMRKGSLSVIIIEGDRS